MHPSLDFLAGGGEMGERIRAMDWSRTPLGPFERWPQSLRSAVSILLPSKAQIILFWGEDLITLYNDAYRPVFGAKHPDALGKPAREAWAEIWVGGLQDLLGGVVKTGEAFWAKDRPFYIERYGYPEETYFDVSYDPVRDESGRVGGVFCIVSETTGRVIGERRLRALRDLRGIGHHATSVAASHAAACEVLAEYAEELPFVLLYETVGGDRTARLAAQCGLLTASSAAPPELPTASGVGWPLADDLRVVSGDALHRFGELRAGPWPEPIREVAVVPIAPAGESPWGHLVAGINPRRRLNEDALDFLGLVASNIAAGLVAARRSEDERRRAELLAELDRAKTVFFSNVSHEFRTPLTLMLGPLEDALAEREPPLPEPQRQRLEMVRRSGLRMQKLVNALLDFSRLEAGRARASYVPTDLATLTTELAASFRAAIEKAGLTLTVDCAALDEPVYVDRDMWEKIVLNLMSNAFKFTFEGGIQVRLRRLDGHVELTVRDSGTGIPAHELPRIFERFRRVEGARSRTHEGTGIGLSLVQDLARLHGGRVEVHSVEGRGSMFTVTLPLGRDHLPAERIGAEPSYAAPATGATHFVEEAMGWLPDEPGGGSATGEATHALVSGVRRPRIVWADDNADLREYVRRILAPHYDVETVPDGEAALVAVRADLPDLVLSDVMMPKLDGVGLLRAMRDNPRTRAVPVILLSARAGEEARTEGLDSGADDYLYKPFSARELLARVAALLRAEELRAEHGRQRALVDRIVTNAPVAIAVMSGSELRFSMVNPAYQEIVGTDVPLLERRFRDVFPEAAERGAEAGLLRVLETGEPWRVRDFETGLPRRPGVSWWDGECLPLTDVEGTIDSVLVLTWEVTERKHVEQVLRDADRRKDEFIATLSHELRNPLAPLRNAIHLLRLTSSRQAPTAAIHEMMERQVDHLVRLVDDLLEISRINSGALELRRERVEVAAIVRNAVETGAPLISEAGHELAMSLPERPLWLEGDPVRLAQVLANLLNNAARYTPAGGHITVRVETVGDRVTIAVADTGVGFDPDMAARLFEMFSRGDRSSGLGIGLALARTLVEMHGGELDGHSAGPGRGAEFVVRLPLAADQSAILASEAPSRAAIARKRILVVDDNHDAANSLQMILELLGAQVRVAQNGQEALAAFAEYDPAVVLLDIGLPDIDGYEVAQAIRERFPGHRVMIVALTGWGQEADRRRGREAGIDHHLVKPADLTVLQALLGSLDERPTGTREVDSVSPSAASPASP